MIRSPDPLLLKQVAPQGKDGVWVGAAAGCVSLPCASKSNGTFHYVPKGRKSRGRPPKRWWETITGQYAYYWKG